MTIQPVAVLLGFTLILVNAATASGQQGDTECGVRCLYVAIHALDSELNVSLNDLKAELNPGDQGNSLLQLHDVAVAHGFHCQGVTTTLENLRARTEKFLCIAHLNTEHYVLLLNIGDNLVEVADPPRTADSIPRTTFESLWSGNALLIAGTEIEREESLRKRVWWNSMRTLLLKLTAWVILLLIAGLWILRWKDRRYAKMIAIIGFTLLSSGCENHKPVPNAFNRTEPRQTDDERRETVSLGRLEIVPSEIDLGAVDVSSRTAVADFAILNHFPHEIGISEIQTSCGCTVATVDSPTLKPGSSTRLTAIVNLTELGEQSSRIRITGSKAGIVAETHIRWSAGSVIRIEPKRVWVGEVQVGMSADSIIRISAPKEEALLECLDRISVFPLATLTLSEDRSQEPWELKVTVSPKSQDKLGRGYLKFHGKNGHPDFRVPVEWNAVEAVSLTPAGHFLGQIPPGSEWKVRCVVASRDLGIYSVQSRWDGVVEVTSSTLANGKVELLFRGVAPMDPGPFRHTLTVDVNRTSDTITRTMSVTGVVRPLAAQ